jgi:ribosomal protein S18 acetylase RimI-like enzyme
MRGRVREEADTATHPLIVTEGGRPIGWAQWYRWDDYPAEAEAVGAQTGDVGIDYGIGEPAATGRGVGRRMIAALVREVRRDQPGAGLLVGPAAANPASCAVLERNGFRLVEARPVATERPIALYRLDPEPVRIATVADCAVIGRLLDRFNREFGEPTPGVDALAARVAALIGGGETDVVLGGRGPDSVAVLRFRPSIWTPGSECYLAELFVTPERRDVGLGRAVMEEALRQARRRGADWISVEVDEPDAAARHLYVSLGFSNRVAGSDGPVMFVYEREL